MFTVETVASEKNGKYITYFWKKDRSYKVFENAEKRVDALHKQGINARMIEKRGCAELSQPTAISQDAEYFGW